MDEISDDDVYAIFHHFWTTQGLNIMQLEALNVLIATKVPAGLCHHQTVWFHLDNEAVVYGLQKGRIRDKYPQAANSVWFPGVTYDIQMNLCTFQPQEHKS